MSKVTLTDINSETAFTADVNANSALIEAAFDNTISRDGTTPNVMNANLDLNSNRILNLPIPQYPNDPVRFQDLLTANLLNVTGTVVIPDPTTHINKVLTSVGTTTPVWAVIPAAPLGLDELVSQGVDRILFSDFSATPAGKIGYLTASTGLNITGTTLTVSLLGLQSLSDPNADRILFWDESSGGTGATQFLTVDSPLLITGTNIGLSSTLTDLSATVDTVADFLLIYDTSSPGWKKCTPASIAGVLGTATTKFKTADTTAAPSSTALVADPHLASFTVLAGQTYSVEGVLIVANPTDASVNWHCQLQATAALASSFVAYQQAAGGANPLAYAVEGGAASFQTDSTFDIRNTFDCATTVTGYIKGGGSDSSVTLAWASDAVDVDATIMRLGSWLRLTKIS